jgi:hypothetical protein
VNERAPATPRPTITLRHWPGIFTAAIAAAMCFGCAYAAFAAVPGMISPEGDWGKAPLGVLIGLALIGLGIFGVWLTRLRVIVDDNGVTAITMSGRATLQWSDITRWEVESAPKQWRIRAWLGDKPYEIFRVRVVFVGLSNRLGTDDWATPPADAPTSIHRAFDTLTNRWKRRR